MNADPPVVRLTDAAFGYDDSPTVRGVTLDVHRGDVLAVLGANGSGKSTLVKRILGLTHRFAGSVEVFGMPWADFRDRARIGYVPQRHTLASTVRATVTEVVASGRLPRTPWWARQSRADRVAIAHALDLVGLADRADVDVTALSGGQQRRVLIARALAGEPDVLVMDEPTAGVDAANQHVLAEVLTRLAATGVTMVVVTHELEIFADLVTRVVVIDDGCVEFDGTAAEFARIGPDVLHDHDSHHHDLELTPPSVEIVGLAVVEHRRWRDG